MARSYHSRTRPKIRSDIALSGPRLRIDLDCRGHAGNQANSFRDLIDLDADRHALSEANPGKYRVDVRDPLMIGVCIRDVNGPRDPAHVAANDLAIAHQFDLGGIAFADGGELRLLETGVDPEGVGIDNRNHGLPDGRIVAHLRRPAPTEGSEA
jgi:hypothetical protein